MRTIDAKFHIENNQIIKTSSAEVVPEDEPLILFRSRDYLALPMLRFYRQLCVADGCTEHQMEKLDCVIDAFANYAATHPTKQPGITRGMKWEPPTSEQGKEAKS